MYERLRFSCFTDVFERKNVSDERPRPRAGTRRSGDWAINKYGVDKTSWFSEQRDVMSKMHFHV